MAATKECRTCAYYANGHCRRHPPRVVMQGTYMTRLVAGPTGSEYVHEKSGEYPFTAWPMVTPSDWCGEHTEPKREPLPALLPTRALRLEDAHGTD